MAYIFFRGGTMAPSFEHTLRSHHPSLQQPRWLPRHHNAKGGLRLSDGGYHHPDSWGLLLRPAVCSASRAQQQSRVFCYSPDYYNRDEEPPEKKPKSFIQGKIALKHAFELIKDNYSGSSSQYEEASRKMLEGLRIMEEIAGDKGNCSDDGCAKDLLKEMLKPVIDDLHGVDDGARSSIVKASLRAIWKLLETAPPGISTILRTEIKSSMERIRDTGAWDDETRNHARKILRTTGVPKL